MCSHLLVHSVRRGGPQTRAALSELSTTGTVRTSLSSLDEVMRSYQVNHGTGVCESGEPCEATNDAASGQPPHTCDGLPNPTSGPLRTASA